MVNNTLDRQFFRPNFRGPGLEEVLTLVQVTLEYLYNDLFNLGVCRSHRHQFFINTRPVEVLCLFPHSEVLSVLVRLNLVTQLSLNSGTVWTTLACSAFLGPRATSGILCRICLELN